MCDREGKKKICFLETTHSWATKPINCQLEAFTPKKVFKLKTNKKGKCKKLRLIKTQVLGVN